MPCAPRQIRGHPGGDSPRSATPIAALRHPHRRRAPMAERTRAPEATTSSRSPTPTTSPRPSSSRACYGVRAWGGRPSRAGCFDVPEYLAAGPRDVLVAASDVPVARDVLREVDPVSGGPRAVRPRLVGRGCSPRFEAVASVGLVVCLATDVFVDQTSNSSSRHVAKMTVRATCAAASIAPEDRSFSHTGSAAANFSATGDKVRGNAQRQADQLTPRVIGSPSSPATAIESGDRRATLHQRAYRRMAGHPPRGGGRGGQERGGGAGEKEGRAPTRGGAAAVLRSPAGGGGGGGGRGEGERRPSRINRKACRSP